MKKRVACVGLTILDVLGRPVERIPDGGNLAFIDEIRLTVAGTAAGTVVDMAKLGLDCSLVAAVGDDEKGRFVRATLDHHGVDTSLLQVVPGVPTSATILPVRPNGERPALHVRGASDHLVVSEAALEMARTCAVVHVGGAGLLRSFDGPPMTAFLKEMRAAGVTTTFDLLAPSESSLSELRAYLPFVDYFMPSMEEAAFISGQTEADAIADFFLGLGARACIFKWGANGSFYASAADAVRVRIPAFRVNVVDTTGCGDAYCAGFVAGLVDGLSPLDACVLGTASSALVATGLGSDAGIVDKAATLAFMATAGRLN